MVRTVKVELQADVAGYIASMRASKDATNEVDGKVEALNRDLDKVPANAAKAAAAMKLLGSDGKAAAMQLDDGIGRNSTSLGVLEGKLTSARMSVHRLAEEFNRTGNSGTLIKLFDAQDEIRGLEDLKTKLVGALDEAGKQGGKDVGAALQGGLSTPALGPVLIATLVGAAIVAAPLMGAAVGGAVVGVFASGGLLAGALLAAKNNTAVQASAKDFGRWLMGELTAGTSGFAQPLEDAFAILKTDLKGPVADLGKDFAYLAPYVRDFATYLGAAVEKFMPGFDRLLQSSGPILTELGHGLVYVADGLNIMFDEISKGGKGEVEALDLLFRVLGGTLAGIGFLIRGLAAAFDFVMQADVRLSAALQTFTHIVSFIIPPMELLSMWLGVIHGLADGVSRSFDDGGPHISGFGRALTTTGADAALTADDLSKLSAQIGQTAATADTLAAAMSKKLFDTFMSVDQATLGWHQSLLQLHDALATNGKQIDKHTGSISYNTKAGLDNRSAILSAVSANMAQYQANVAAGISAEDAAAAYDSNTAALEKQLHQAGYTTAQIDGLIGKYKQVPDEVNTAVAIEGLAKAIDDLVELQRYLAGLPSTKYIDIVTRQTMVTNINSPGSFGHPNRWGGVYEHAATGLLREAAYYGSSNPGRYMIAEPQTGGEGFVPKYGDYRRSTAIIDQEARWYGGRFVPHTSTAKPTGGNMAVTFHIHGVTDPRAVADAVDARMTQHARTMNLRNRGG